MAVRLHKNVIVLIENTAREKKINRDACVQGTFKKPKRTRVPKCFEATLGQGNVTNKIVNSSERSLQQMKELPSLNTIKFMIIRDWKDSKAALRSVNSERDAE